MVKVFLFCQDKRCAGRPGGDPNSDWHSVVALAGSGDCIGQHVCSNHGFMRGDLVEQRPERIERLNEMFPGGWEIEVVDDPRPGPNEHSGLQRAYARNQALAALEETA